MQTADTGVQNKPSEDPGKAGENKETTAPVVETVTVPKADLEGLNATLAQAENRIVQLKKELDTVKDPGDGEIETDLKAELEAIRAEIAGLKTQQVQKEDKTLEELQAAKSKITELTKVAIHQKTMTQDSAGSGQTVIPEKPKSDMPEAKTAADKEVLERVRQRRVASGRDPETGKLLAK